MKYEYIRNTNLLHKHTPWGVHCALVIVSLLYDLMILWNVVQIHFNSIELQVIIGSISITYVNLSLFLNYLIFWCLLKSDLDTHCVWESPASSSRLWTAGYSSNVAHESKLQNSSVDPAVRSGLWKNIQDQNCRGFEFRSTERRNTSSSTYLSIVMLKSWKIESLKNI